MSNTIISTIYPAIPPLSKPTRNLAHQKIFVLPSDCTHLPYKDTHSFSALVNDYLAKDEKLRGFYRFDTDISGIEKAIEERGKYPVDRALLTRVLEKQYADIETTDAVKQHIQQLKEETTFTICTAHQPNLLTGYLYFIYKIIHAIKLAHELSEKYPDKHFVPVYYMGSEDNDLDELGTFRYGAEKYVWDANGQTGAVGRMHTKSLKSLLDQLFRRLGPPGDFTERLKELLTQAYLQHATIGKATQFLVNELFGKYGLVVIDPDDAELKKAFAEVMKDDLLQGKAEGLVKTQIEKISAHYKSQAYPRSINLFYLKDDLRERIEKNGDVWKVLNTDISFTEKELLNELGNHPDRFSPNVVLRGVFQETILPDVAFIGGGAEVAYWLQLKTAFEHYHVFYPAILLRQSVQWIPEDADKRRKDLHLSFQELFLPKEELLNTYFLKQAKEELNIDEETNELDILLEKLKTKATHVDATLEYSADAVQKKINYQLDILRKKMLRAEKKKHAVIVERIEKLKQRLFPNGGLQERVENFIEYYPLYGDAFFEILYTAIKPLQHEFLIIHSEK